MNNSYHCSDMQMNYMRRSFVGLLDILEFERLMKHLNSCEECGKIFLQLSKEENIKNICTYCQYQMRRFVWSDFQYNKQREEIQKHIESCSACMELYRKEQRKRQDYFLNSKLEETNIKTRC